VRGITNAKERDIRSRAKKVDRGVARLPSIPKELVSLFLTGPMTGEAINEAGIAFKKALIEASLNAGLSHHLGYGGSGARGGYWTPASCPIHSRVPYRSCQIL
jgi:hypothetical protein